MPRMCPWVRESDESLTRWKMPVISISCPVSEGSFRSGSVPRSRPGFAEEHPRGLAGGSGRNPSGRTCTHAPGEASSCAQQSLQTKGSGKDTLPLNSPNGRASESLGKKNPDEPVNGSLTPLPAAGVDVPLSSVEMCSDICTSLKCPVSGFCVLVSV